MENRIRFLMNIVKVPASSDFFDQGAPASSDFILRFIMIPHPPIFDDVVEGKSEDLNRTADFFDQGAPASSNF
jgi:hypothetical protein